MREGPGHLVDQRSTEFGAIQLTIDDRYDYMSVYIAVIRVKGNPLRAQKSRFELVEGMDSKDTAQF